MASVQSAAAASVKRDENSAPQADFIAKLALDAPASNEEPAPLGKPARTRASASLPAAPPVFTCCVLPGGGPHAAPRAAQPAQTLSALKKEEPHPAAAAAAPVAGPGAVVGDVRLVPTAILIQFPDGSTVEVMVTLAALDPSSSTLFAVLKEAAVEAALASKGLAIVRKPAARVADEAGKGADQE